jgi:hypothetical protein
MKKRTKTLTLLHGRYTVQLKHPYAKNGWGFNGPELQGILGMTFTYGELTLWFDDIYKVREIQKLTGWKIGCCDSTLEIPIKDGMVECLHTDEHGQTRQAYFGDWYLE